jgi:hypothetical protein
MDKNEILAQLTMQDTSCREWSIKSGYQPRTVYQLIDRFAGGDVLPRGVLGFSILKKLSQQIGSEIVPGLLTPEEKAALPKSADIGAFGANATSKGDAA